MTRKLINGGKQADYPKIGGPQGGERKSGGQGCAKKIGTST